MIGVTQPAAWHRGRSQSHRCGRFLPVPEERRSGSGLRPGGGVPCAFGGQHGAIRGAPAQTGKKRIRRLQRLRGRGPAFPLRSRLMRHAVHDRSSAHHSEIHRAFIADAGHGGDSRQHPRQRIDRIHAFMMLTARVRGFSFSGELPGATALPGGDDVPAARIHRPAFKHQHRPRPAAAAFLRRVTEVIARDFLRRVRRDDPVRLLEHLRRMLAQQMQQQPDGNRAAFDVDRARAVNAAFLRPRVPPEVMPRLLLCWKNRVRMRDEHHRLPARAGSCQEQMMPRSGDGAGDEFAAESQRCKRLRREPRHRIHACRVRREAVDAHQFAQEVQRGRHSPLG